MGTRRFEDRVGRNLSQKSTLRVGTRHQRNPTPEIACLVQGQVLLCCLWGVVNPADAAPLIMKVKLQDFPRSTIPQPQLCGLRAALQVAYRLANIPHRVPFGISGAQSQSQPPTHPFHPLHSFSTLTVFSMNRASPCTPVVWTTST